jgi:hypothetical protein
MKSFNIHNSSLWTWTVALCNARNVEAYDLPLPWAPPYLVTWDPVDTLGFMLT